MRFIVPAFVALLALVALITVSACTGFGTAAADQARAELRDQTDIPQWAPAPNVTYLPSGPAQLGGPVVMQGTAE